MDVGKELQDKKKSNEAKIKAAFDRYMHSNGRCREIDAERVAKAEIKAGTLTLIQEKEKECDAFEIQIYNVNLESIDKRDKQMQIDLERKTNQLAERSFDSNRNQKQSEIYTLEQKIKALSYERDSILADSRDRVELSLKKSELENNKKKHKKILLQKEYEELNSKAHESEMEVKEYKK